MTPTALLDQALARLAEAMESDHCGAPNDVAEALREQASELHAWLVGEMAKRPKGDVSHET